MRQKTIFRQLILYVIIPTFFVLLGLAILNFSNTKKILQEGTKTENTYISDEITNIIQFQDLALNVLEENLNEKMRSLSNQLVTNYFKSTKNIEDADLYKIREELGMNPEMTDIYIINKNGIVVNTTFKKDLFLDFFSFGEEHKNLLINILEEKKLHTDRFAIEATTKRVKKYTYQSTLDSEFIVEIGFYSDKADEILQTIKTHLFNISQKKETILSVDLFIVTDIAFSLNKESILNEDEFKIIDGVVNSQKNKTKEVTLKGNKLFYEYVFLGRKNTSLYKKAVIRIISDRSSEDLYLKTELWKLLIIFIIVIIAVSIILYFNSRAITKPIEELSKHVDKVSAGNYNINISTKSFQEISKLSKGFNSMLENLRNRNLEIESQSKNLRVTNRDLQEAYELLNKQKNIIESKNKDLTSSINYSLKIQRSFIPPLQSFYDIFPESFVYYLPRDIVSGDFYWFTKTENQIIITVGDCSGHGVPGAFTSLIGMSLLHQIINYEKVTDPSEILTKLDRQIYDMLKNSLNEDNFFVGMDISVCSINMKENKLLFSGAQRPLLMIRDNQINSYRGNIYPIGEFYNNLKKEFNNTSIDLQKGDSIYMFTDGYTTQFSEKDNSKFTVKRLQELLLSISESSLKEQKTELNKQFLEWKGKQLQIDDILVLGFKY
jgi:phosphoserine phosphatase RsbU/P